MKLSTTPMSKNTDAEMIKKEEAAKTAALQTAETPTLSKEQETTVLHKIITEQVEKEIAKVVAEQVGKPQTVIIKNTEDLKTELPTGPQEVKGMKALNENIVALGKFIMQFIQTVDDIKKIEGNVTTDVVIPEIQKVSGDVKASVDFPDMQKIQGAVTTDIPRIKLGNVEVLPVAFWNGKRFVEPGSQQSVQGNGRSDASMRALTAQNRETWTPTAYSGISNTIVTAKASAGKLGGYYYGNPNASIVYLQVFIDKDAVVLGTTAPDGIYELPASGAAHIDISKGVGFNKRLQIAATTQPNGAVGPTTPLPVTLYFNQP